MTVHVYDTGSDAERLFVRPTSSGDNAEPSGAAALASAFVMAFALTGEPRRRERAEQCLAQLSSVMASAPRFAGWALAAAEALASGPVQVAVVLPENADGAQREQWRRLVARATSPGLAAVIGTPDEPGVPLLAGHPLVVGRAAAYVCRGFVCDAPVTSPHELARRIGVAAQFEPS